MGLQLRSIRKPHDRRTFKANLRLNKKDDGSRKNYRPFKTILEAAFKKGSRSGVLGGSFYGYWSPIPRGDVQEGETDGEGPINDWRRTSLNKFEGVVYIKILCKSGRQGDRTGMGIAF